MGTRGFFGFKDKSGKIHGWYNHFDSYPTGLGEIVINKLSKLTIDQIHEFFTKKLSLIEERSDGGGGGGDPIYEAHKDIFDMDWKKIASVTLYSGREFYKDGLFCEYAYIYDLKTNRLMCFKGFGKNPQKGYEDWVYTADYAPFESWYVRKQGVIQFPSNITEAKEKLKKIYGKSYN